MMQPFFDSRLVQIAGLRGDQLIEGDVPEEGVIALGNPETVIVEGRLSQPGDVAQPAKRLRIKIIRQNQRCSDEVLGHPPREVRGDFPERIDEPDDDSVSFASIYPAMEAAARPNVCDDGFETAVRALQMMQHADAVNEVETVAAKRSKIRPRDSIVFVSCRAHIFF